MNRRDILKGLGLSGLGLGLFKNVKANNNVKIVNNTEIFEYKSFRYMWTGWKSALDNTRLSGQWIAIHPNNKTRIYSCTGGCCGEYYKGAVFNITVLEGRNWTDINTSKTILDIERNEAEKRLHKCIDEYYVSN